MRSIVKMGTARSVTEAITPSEPTPTRAAARASGSLSSVSSTTWPAAVTSRMAATCDEMLR